MTDPTRFERTARRHRFTARRAVVERVDRPLDGVLRIALGGPDFADFESTGPADHVRLYFPGDDGVLVAPAADPSGEGLIRPDALTINRDYTPLRPRRSPGGGGFEVDVMDHDDPGPATRWALAASPGDELVAVGPRGSREAPTDLEGLVLIVDETSLPAASRWIADAPPVPTFVIAAVRRGEEWLEQYLDPPSRVDVRAVPMDAGGEAWLEAVRETPIEPGDFVFAAGEATALTRIRRHLLGALGLPREQVDVSGYWRRGVVGFDHHTPLED